MNNSFVLWCPNVSFKNMNFMVQQTGNHLRGKMVIKTAVLWCERDGEEEMEYCI